MRYLKEFRHIILYGLILALLVFALKWLEWKFILVDNAIDIYIGFVALFFTLLGIWVASHIMRPKIETLIVEKEILVLQSEPFTLNTNELQKLNLNNREYEVLQLLKSRTQAITKAKQLKIIA